MFNLQTSRTAYSNGLGISTMDISHFLGQFSCKKDVYNYLKGVLALVLPSYSEMNYHYFAQLLTNAVKSIKLAQLKISCVANVKGLSDHATLFM